MFFDFGRSERIRKLLSELDLVPFLKKAKELFNLSEKDFATASAEYRHFLYLAYWNRSLGFDHKNVVVPTKRADALWHAHILHTRQYRVMCDTIFGKFLDHNPGLEEGSQPFDLAIRHTKLLHDFVTRKRRKPGFDDGYFAHVKLPEYRPDTSKRSRSSSDGGGDFPSPSAFDVGNNHSPFGGGSAGGGGAFGDIGGDDGGGAGCSGGCGGD